MGIRKSMIDYFLMKYLKSHSNNPSLNENALAGCSLLLTYYKL